MKERRSVGAQSDHAADPPEGETQLIQRLQQEIAERRQAEDALRESEREYRFLFEHNPLAMYAFDPVTLAILSVNEAAVRQYGYSADEFLTMTLKDLREPEDVPLLMEDIAQLPSGLSAPRVWRHRKKDGTFIFVEITGHSGTIAGRPARIVLLNDVTERTLAEEKLARTAARYRDVVENASDIIYSTDAQGRFTYANPAGLRITGYGLDELTTMRYSDLVLPGYRMTVARTYYHQAKTGCTTSYVEFPFRQKSGGIKWIGQNSTLIINNGTLTGYNMIARDITERVMIQEALSESEEKYKLLLNHSPVGIAVHSEGKIVFSNAECARILGAGSPAEIVGVSIESVVHPLHLRAARERLQRLLEGETGLYPTEELYVKMDGTPVPVEVMAVPITYLGAPAVQVLVTDITAWKEAEERVNLLSHTVKSITECVSVTDLQNRILFVNQAFLTTYGYAEDEVIGRMIGEITLPTGIMSQAMMTATQAGDWQGELINRKKDGTEFPIHLSTSIVHDEQGNAVALVGVAVDITEQKKIQQELLQTQKIQSIGTLAGGIAHDFNNILGIILGYTNLLETRIGADPKHHSSLQAIQLAVERGTALVGQILTFARKTEVLYEAVDVVELAHELQTMLQQTFPKTIVFKQRLDDDLPLIKADRSQMHQVLLNLCVNARDAMPNGGSIMLTGERMTLARVKERFPKADEAMYVCLGVQDTGEGMTKETQRRVFDPFFTTKPLGKGTGLGLSVVYGVLEAHHGFIELESEPGQGTLFRLYIPASIAEKTTTDESNVEESSELRGTETLLLVEDEQALLELLSMKLESRGYTVHRAENGNDAIAVYQQHSREIDLVVTDMGLPGMSGAEEFRRLRELDPRVKVIFASGFLEPGTKAALRSAGASGFIQKPYKPRDVLAVIRDVLDAS